MGWESGFKSQGANWYQKWRIFEPLNRVLCLNLKNQLWYIKICDW